MGLVVACFEEATRDDRFFRLALAQEDEPPRRRDIPASHQSVTI
jgi:hypothetical protein